MIASRTQKQNEDVKLNIEMSVEEQKLLEHVLTQLVLSAGKAMFNIGPDASMPVFELLNILRKT